MSTIFEVIRKAQESSDPKDREKSIEDLRSLVQKSESVTDARETNLPHRTALMVAAMGGPVELLSILREAGADLNAIDDNGWTALVYAVRSCNNDGVNFLLTSGANTEISDKNGWTALLHAAKLGNVAILGLLLAHGADADYKTPSGKTVFTVAKNEEVINYIKFKLEAKNDKFWKQLYGQLRETLVKEASRFTQCDPEDLVQQAFLNLYSRVKNCGVVKHLSAYLRTAVKNIGRDKWRANTREQQGLQAYAAHQNLFSEALAQLSEQARDEFLTMFDRQAQKVLQGNRLYRLYTAAWETGAIFEKELTEDSIKELMDKMQWKRETTVRTRMAELRRALREVLMLVLPLQGGVT